jgi:hypothetical protein
MRAATSRFKFALSLLALSCAFAVRPASAQPENCLGCFENSVRIYGRCIAAGGSDSWCTGDMCFALTVCNVNWTCGWNCPL